MNRESIKMNEPNKLALRLFKRLDLRSLNKQVALQNWSICYTWKNIRKQFKINKPKIKAPACNDDFDLTDGSYSVSDIQDYIEYIIKNMKH